MVRRKDKVELYVGRGRTVIWKVYVVLCGSGFESIRVSVIEYSPGSVEFDFGLIR